MGADAAGGADVPRAPLAAVEASDRVWTLPNALSSLRLLLVPVFAVLITRGEDGWALTGLECASSETEASDSTTAGSTATINLDHGETIRCTFANTELASIEIVKEADPESAQDFRFTATSPGDAANPLPAAFQLDDDHPTAAATVSASTCSRTSWTRKIVAPRS